MEAGSLIEPGIAAAVGYKNSSQLIANFKKVHGFTPNEFRKLFGL